MATKPTPGGSDGTYGTEMNAFLDESLASDGKIKDGAVLEAQTLPADPDRTVADAAFVKANGHPDIDSSATAVTTIYLTGTLDNDASTDKAHGLSLANILAVSVMVGDGVDFFLTDVNVDSATANDANRFIASVTATNVAFRQVGTNLQGQAYKIKIDHK